MNKHAPNGEKAQDSGVDLEQLSKVSTSGLEPWMNPDISAEEQLAEYKKFVDEKLAGIKAAYERADDALKREIENDPETEAYIREGQLLAKMDVDSFTAQLPPLSKAAMMVSSYFYDKTAGLSTFTIPASMTDVDAMKALNEYFWKNLASWQRRYAVYAEGLDWYEKLPEQYPEYCQERDYSQARHITITAVVEGTLTKDRTTQEAVLREKSLVFADPRDQALAGALHACKHDGQTLFKGVPVTGSVPGFALVKTPFFGVDRARYFGKLGHYDIAASGSPSPESKN